MLLARLKDTPSDKSGAWRTFGKGVGKPGLTRAASSVLHVHDEDFMKSSRQQPVAQRSGVQAPLGGMLYI